MAVTPTGMLSLALERLADMLANSSAFQTWVGAADAAAAAASIYRWSIPPAADGADGYARVDLEALRPYAVIWLDEFEAEHVAGDGDATNNRQFNERFEMMIHFEDDVAEADADSHDDVYIRFANTVGGVVGTVLAQAGQSGVLAISRARVHGFARTHEDDRAALGDAVQMLATITVEN